MIDVEEQAQFLYVKCVFCSQRYMEGMELVKASPTTVGKSEQNKKHSDWLSYLF